MVDIHLEEIIPFFRDSSHELNTDFCTNAIGKNFPRGTFLTMEGDHCAYFPIIKSGIVRVYKLSPRGQEMTLYRIEPGESCVLTMSCLLGKNSFPAIAVVENDCEVFLIPSDKLKKWILKYPKWNEYIFNYLSNVLVNVIGLLEDITFKRMDSRILEYLADLTLRAGNELVITHSKIAQELGTAREVVSRILKELERENLITLSRGQITVNDIRDLQRKLNLLHT